MPWVIHMTSMDVNDDLLESVAKTLADAVGISRQWKSMIDFQEKLTISCAVRNSEEGGPEMIQRVPGKDGFKIWTVVQTKRKGFYRTVYSHTPYIIRERHHRSQASVLGVSHL
jgi:hypothetical protein